MSLRAELERAENSRKVPKFSFGDVVVHLSHELVELASGSITFHLPIPIIILERMQKRFQLATLFQRKLFNRSENFSNRAHAGKLSARRIGVNKAKARAVCPNLKFQPPFPLQLGFLNEFRAMNLFSKLSRIINGWIFENGLLVCENNSVINLVGADKKIHVCISFFETVNCDCLGGLVFNNLEHLLSLSRQPLNGV